MKRILVVVIGVACARSAMADGHDLTLAAGISTTTSAASPMQGLQLLGNTQSRSVESVMDDRSVEASGILSVRYRLGERVVWSVPTLSFAYLGGESGKTQWIPWGGVTSWGVGYSSINHLLLDGTVGAGAGIRQWLGSSASINATAGVATSFAYTSKPICGGTDTMCDRWTDGDGLRASATLGTSIDVGTTWTFNAAVGGSNHDVSFGSIQTLALRTLPLVEAHVSDAWSIDGYAAATYDLSSHRYEQTYLLGVTRLWSH
jgi:hypothetical protein